MINYLIHECVWRLVCNLRQRALAAGRTADAAIREFPFLAPYVAEVQSRLPDHIGWDESLDWFAAQAPESALTALCPSHHSALTLIFAGLVDEDTRFANLYATLHGPSAIRRPTLNLLRELLGINTWEPFRALLDAGALDVLNPEAPRSEWAVRVPSPLWSAIRGEPESEPAPGLRYSAPDDLPAFDDLLLPQPALQPVLAEPGRVLLIRGLPGSDRLALAGALARSLQRGTLTVEGPPADRTRLLGPLCAVTHAIPVFLADLAAGETLDTPRLRSYDGPIFVVMSQEGGLSTSHSQHALTVEVPVATAPERALHWDRALHGHAPTGLATAFTMQPHYIRRSAKLAADYAALEGRTEVTPADVRLAARAINRQVLDPLAARLTDGSNWRNLVVGSHTYQELRNLERRCRHREQLASSQGPEFPGGLNRGVRALFEGPSGTGKTLAARVLGAELGLDVHRVDLASIVNKYIGETEKNLSRVLSRAEDLDIVLLLDEGDSLMTRRTEVRTANDRYANLETNYLLQRLETYTGIVIVTTNTANAIDSAFRRRFDCVVKFQTPDAPERFHLWSLHLPPDHAISFEDLERIALRYTLTGGQIRNAAVHASLLAMSEGATRVATPDLQAAIQAEYRKAGAGLPAADSNPDPQRSDQSLSAFLGSIS